MVGSPQEVYLSIELRSLNDELIFRRTMLYPTGSSQRPFRLIVKISVTTRSIGVSSTGSPKEESHPVFPPFWKTLLSPTFLLILVPLTFPQVKPSTTSRGNSEPSTNTEFSIPRLCQAGVPSQAPHQFGIRCRYRGRSHCCLKNSH